LSPATINKDLRTVKTALNIAVEWGYLESVPKFKTEREPKHLPRYVTPEHFTDIYKACEIATFPTELPYAPSDWWRALLVTLQMTGWRIGEVLALEWDDVNLDTGMAITRASDNKGKRDEIVRLHQTVLDHIGPLRTFHLNVFPWEDDKHSLYKQFHLIQNEAGIHLPCNIQQEHECTATCHLYGFHDERRAFASMNAMNMTREALQALMRRQSPQTTDRYINFAQQLNPAVANLHVPDVLKADGA
jgi:integrase